MSTNIGTIDHAVETYWQTDTTGKGHLSRGRAFHAAVQTLVNEGEKKGAAQKIIAEQVAEAAPAHEKKFGSATVSHYNASFALFEEETCNFHPTTVNADLYAAVHKAYAASMGVENLRQILSIFTDTPDGREQAIQHVVALKRGDKPENEGEEKKGRSSFGLRAALNALAKIQEKDDWTEDEKGQLFEACLATSVAVQPSA